MKNERIIIAMKIRNITKLRLSSFLECPPSAVPHILRFELAEEEQQKILAFIESQPLPEAKPPTLSQNAPELRIKTKEDLHRLIGANGIKQWQIARALNLSESYFSRTTRTGFTQSQWDKIVAIVENAKDGLSK